MNNKLREEKGAITLFVVVSMMFLMLILLAVFTNTRNVLIEHEKQIEIIISEYHASDEELKALYLEAEYRGDTY